MEWILHQVCYNDSYIIFRLSLLLLIIRLLYKIDWSVAIKYPHWVFFAMPLEMMSGDALKH